MNRIINFIVFICLITGLLFVGPPSVLAAESPASTVSIPQAANYTAISAGHSHIVALKDNGTVAAWGNNEYGQCTVPAGLSGVKAVAAGNSHTVALKEDGTVVAWGNNDYVQCTVPAGLSGVKAIATGYYYTVALKEDGTILAWGYNGYGKCTAPTGLSGVKAIAAGNSHTVTLKEDGTVVAWGYNEYGQCTAPTGLSGVKAIAAGNSYTVALKEDGTVAAWGYNSNGQCTVPTGLSGVKAIAAGYNHTVALKEDGTIVAWGYNGNGQCNVPTGLSGVKAITATSYSTFVLKGDGTIISFGKENYIIPSTKASSANAMTPSNAEFNTSSPESITVKMYAEGSNKLTGIKNGTNSLRFSDYSLSGSAITISKAYLSSSFAFSDKLSLTFDFDNGVDPVLSIEKNDGSKNPIYKSISSGYNFTLALKRDNTVVAWGDNGDSQCNVPAGLSGIKAVAAGYSHSVALKEDGTVTVWGYNIHGECNVPAGLSGVKAISAGQYHTVALKEDGTIVGWGYNTYAQCASPAGLYGVKDIAAGGNFTVALKTDGTVVAWGNNDNGQCNVPAGLCDVKAISASHNHVVALKTDGTVVAWGYNSYNQCNVPSGLSGVKAISAGYHTVALKEDGTLITWGYNENGQCSVPAGLSGVKSVSARYYSTAALKDNDTIISFGNQNYIIPYSKPLSANSLNLHSTEFDSLNPSDISVKTYASDKNKLIGIKNRTDSLTGSDYSVSGNAVIINKSYLSSYFANTSKLSLTFDFDNGNDPVLTVEKNDGGKDSIYKDIKSGYSSTIALKTDGTVAVLGDNSYGECNIPAGLSGVKAITAGQYYFVALKEDGTVTAWGDNEYKQCKVPVSLSNVKAIAAGEYHVLALKEDGTVVAWGYNNYGQCMIPAGLSCVKAIAAGQYFSAALKEDGTVITWGYNNYGQCNIPAGLSGVKAIAAGDNHIVAVKKDGTVVAWGYNGSGQCNVPSGLSGVKAVATGDIHTVALKEDGTITAWGYNDNGECTMPAGLSDVKAISAGCLYTSVLKKDDTIISFGYRNFTIPSSKLLSVNSITPYISGFDTSNPNDIAAKIYTNGNKLISIKSGSDLLSASDYSVSGSAVTINKSYLSSCFTKASKLLLTFDFDNGNDPVLAIEKANISAQNFKSVAVGQHHSVALKGDSTVTTWGYNDYGQCSIPAGFSGVKAVAAGDNYSAALKEDGTVVVWGYNSYGLPKGLSGVKAIAAGNNFVVALKEDGTVVAWGQNNYKQCTVPAGLSGVKSIAAGLYHTVALKEDGTITAWGNNSYGQCTIPSGLSGVKSIATGLYHTVALKEDGTVIVWGYNDNGQCNVPSGLSSVKALSAGGNHTMALKEDGIVIAWGDNDYDQCKNFNGLTNVKAISTGRYHSIALKEDGAIFAGGYNNYGECAAPLGGRVKAISAGSNHTAVLKEDGTLNIWGSNDYGQCNVPDGLSNVKAVVVGRYHTVALKEDGTVTAWGYNSDKQCNVPSDLSGVKAIVAGAYHTVALKEDGTVVAWGCNGSGQCKIPAGLSGVKAISAGQYHTVALKEDSTVVAWGCNGNGQCTIPDGLSGVKAIIAGDEHTVALKEDGTVVAWGYNGYNQCTIPSGLSGVKAISAVGYYTVALKEDGTIVSWGNYTAPSGVSGVKAISGSTVLKEDGTVIDLRNNCIISFPKAASTNLINPSSAGFDSLNPLDVHIDIDAGAGKLVAIKIGNDTLTSSDYTVSGSAVTISKNYLASVLTKTAPLGQKISLTFDFDNGNDPILTVQKVSTPVITVDPMEVTVGKSNDVMITVNSDGHPVAGGITVDIGNYVKGQVLDSNGQAKVAVTPTTAGDIVVNAYDINHNLLTSKTIKAVAAATTDSSIAPSTDIFNTLSPVDIKTTMTLNGNTLVNIMNGATPLSKSDYSVNGNIVTINKGFFSYYFDKFGKFKNNCILTFKFSSGKDATLTVKPIFDAILIPDTINYDLNNPADVKVTMSLNGNTLVGIMNGAAPLSKSDYSVNGNVATINKGFFSYYFSKFNNNCSLRFVFSDGKYAFLTVKPYTNANDPSISPNTTTCNIVSPEAIQVTLTLNGSTLGSIMNGSAPLTKYDYSVNGNVVTISKGYLTYYFGRFPKYNCNLTFKFSNGKDILLTIKSLTLDSSVSPVEAVYDMTTPQSITVALTLNGNKLTSIKDSVKTLSEGTDYVVSGGSVLLNTDYLNNLPIGDSTLTFNFDAGKSASLKVTVNGVVKDSTISPDTATCSVTTPESIKVTMALNGNTLVNVMNGAAPLTKYDYSVSGNVVTINKSYFVYYFGRFPKYNCTLTFKFSNGKDAVFTVKPAQ